MSSYMLVFDDDGNRWPHCRSINRVGDALEDQRLIM
jgi:hypothetical protein